MVSAGLHVLLSSLEHAPSWKLATCCEGLGGQENATGMVLYVLCARQTRQDTPHPMGRRYKLSLPLKNGYVSFALCCNRKTKSSTDTKIA